MNLPQKVLLCTSYGESVFTIFSSWKLKHKKICSQNGIVKCYSDDFVFKKWLLDSRVFCGKAPNVITHHHLYCGKPWLYLIHEIYFFVRNVLLLKKVVHTQAIMVFCIYHTFYNVIHWFHSKQNVFRTRFRNNVFSEKKYINTAS